MSSHRNAGFYYCSFNQPKNLGNETASITIGIAA
jgi:hypothetical protein